MNRPRSRRAFVLFALAMAAAALAGCDGSNSTIGKDLQVTNAADNFQFQVTDMKEYNKTIQYSWTNSGTTATVNQSCSITGGTPTLSIHDALGTLVYARNLRENGDFPTSAGAAGTWRITLSLSNVSGTLNFRVQKV